ncbi:MAG TPA: zinc ribbon domain-containing protein [Anaerolineales bacterium]|nr:zinc ribbon domain-containing protein [Anaerolineales bacterium]
MCPSCGARNDAGVDSCSTCGAPLSTVQRIFGTAAKPTRPLWLDEARQRAQGLKDGDLKPSEERMGALLDIDRRREASHAEAVYRQRERDRKLIRLMLVAFVLFLAAIALVTVLNLVNA